MYTFPQQQKIFKDLLASNPSNNLCADCDSIGPTWASLNFGVFLCSNCSGAHRALGPTITRVKSTKLDQWQKSWLQCMQIGNKQINSYWQSNLQLTKKPRMGATQSQLIKYATEKYIRKKYIKNINQDDPLTKYKKGTYSKNQKVQESKTEQLKPQSTKINNKIQKIQIIRKSPDQKSNVAVQNQKKSINLIEFQFPEEHKLQVKSKTSMVHHNKNQNKLSNNTEDGDLSEFTEHGTSFTGTSLDPNLTFDELVAQKSSDNNRDERSNSLPAMNHAQSDSFFTQNHSPHFNVNMNGHIYHVGGHLHNGHIFNGTSGNNQNYKYFINQNQRQNQNPYQGVASPINQTNIYQPQQQRSSFSNCNNNFLSGHQNRNLQYQNNNFTQINLMSNQPINNYSNQSLGGYHNQGYGSHNPRGQINLLQNQKVQNFQWNDHSGWSGMGFNHQNKQNQQQNQGKSGNSWLDEWK